MALEIMSDTNFSNMRRPITELTDRESIQKEFGLLLAEAKEGASKRLNRAKVARRFFNGDHYNTQNGFGFLQALQTKNNSHIPRLSGEETQDAIQNLLPILVKSKPGTTVVPENEDLPIDLRELDEFGDLTGIMSSIPPSLVAQALTEILESLYERQSRHILDANIVCESLISGIAYVSHEFSQGKYGITCQPRLLEPDQFLGDPDATNSWDFSDYRYIIISEKRTPWEIYLDHQITEDDYSGGEDNQGQNQNLLFGRGKGAKPDSNPDKYDEYTLYFQPYTPRLGEPGGSMPYIQKMSFIGENYYVEGSKESIRYWHKEYPITAFQPTPQPFESYGVSEVATLIATQIAVNIARDSGIATSLFNANTGYDIEDDVAVKTQQ